MRFVTDTSRFAITYCIVFFAMWFAAAEYQMIFYKPVNKLLPGQQL
jgi:hypothetical protein